MDSIYRYGSLINTNEPPDQPETENTETLDSSNKNEQDLLSEPNTAVENSEESLNCE